MPTTVPVQASSAPCTATYGNIARSDTSTSSHHSPVPLNQPHIIWCLLLSPYPRRVPPAQQLTATPSDPWLLLDVFPICCANLRRDASSGSHHSPRTRIECPLHRNKQKCCLITPYIFTGLTRLLSGVPVRGATHRQVPTTALCNETNDTRLLPTRVPCTSECPQIRN